MEYCGGGDLSTVIKHATKQNRMIPEGTIWNYFYQVLQALHHCHHPQRRLSVKGIVPVEHEFFIEI
jgi:serine/threonine protein kinase